MTIVLQGWALVLRLPGTLRAVLEALRPGGYGLPDREVWAFGKMDAAFRPAYNRIARSYQQHGRFGYIFCEGLGMPLGMRIYNNLGTYKLLQWLGTRRMQALGYLLMIVASGVIVGLSFNVYLGVVVGLLAAGSPLIIGSYTHGGKPESLWWGVALLFAFTAFSGPAVLAGLLWSLLAWVNLAVSIMLILTLGPALLANALLEHSLVGLAIGLAPGVAKHAFRLLCMCRAGFLRPFASEQSRVWKRPWFPRQDEWVVLLPYAVSIAASTYASGYSAVGVVILLASVGAFWANCRVICVNDITSFYLCLWVIGLGYSASMHAPIGLTLILLFAYTHPGLHSFPPWMPFSYQEASVLQRWVKDYRKQITGYPALTPLRFPRPEPLVEFFYGMPDGTRFIFESDGDPRTQSRFRAFRIWTGDLLAARQIEMANSVYTRIVEPELADHYLLRFNNGQMSAQEMHWICQVLGASHVVAFTTDTIKALERVGYQSVRKVDLNALEEFRSVVGTPRETLTLLRGPLSVGVIEPAVQWKLEGNTLSWNAKAQQQYIVRYRYDDAFRAGQSGKAIMVDPVRPVDSLPLTFMRVTAPADGAMTLKFHPRWI